MRTIRVTIIIPNYYDPLKYGIVIDRCIKL